RLGSSKWFTRGWTLQELIAPSVLEFYLMEWKLLGTKSDLSSELENKYYFFKNPISFEKASVAEKMSWVASRITTRSEDMAYCLLGLFDVNMLLLYGEGSKAFLRLQQELLKVSNDQSLFSW
ncbi:hypothetical protein EJ08DRAFT_568801, partial [Tothia fuscella]